MNIYENWQATLTKLETTFLQSVTGYKRLGRKSNIDIRDKLDMLSLNERIYDCKNMWKIV